MNVRSWLNTVTAGNHMVAYPGLSLTITEFIHPDATLTNSAAGILSAMLAEMCARKEHIAVVLCILLPAMSFFTKAP
jgi:hypothetical protein